MVLREDGEDLLDIKDGMAIRDLKGPDGKPFLDGYKRSELRLVWSLSVDWFNPFFNKQAGKTASCGSIAMLLLNLLPAFAIDPKISTFILSHRRSLPAIKSTTTWNRLSR